MEILTKLGGMIASFPDVEIGFSKDLPALIEALPSAKAVFCVGSIPLHGLQEAGFLPKKRTVTSLRKIVHTLVTTPLMVSYSPTIGELDYGKFIDLLTDTNIALRLAKTGHTEPQYGKYSYIPDLSSVVSAVSAIIKDKGRCDLAFDTETLGLDRFDPKGYIISLQFSWEKGQGCMVVFTSKAESLDFLLSMKNQEDLHWLLTCPQIYLRAANGKYDLEWVYEQCGVTCTNFKFDTTVVGSLLDENRSNALDVHAKIYAPDLSGYSDVFDRTANKSRMDLEYLKSPENFLKYSCGDSDATLQVSNAERVGLLADKQLTAFYVNVLHPAARAFELVERGGVYVDKNAFDELEADLIADQHRLIKIGKQTIGGILAAKHYDSTKNGGVNLTKAALITDFMFSPMGLNLKPKLMTAGGAEGKGKKSPSSALEHLEMFKDVPEAKDFVNTLREFSSTNKTLSTFVVGFRKHIRSDGKLHPTYFLFKGNRDDGEGGASTGRLSVHGPAFQTIPKMTTWSKRIRDCYIAPPGHVVLECIAEGSWVSTTRGLVKIEEITQGDSVCVEGNNYPVADAWKTGENRPTVVVKTRSGQSLTTTPDHVFFALRDGIQQEIFAKDLKTTDLVLTNVTPVSGGAKTQSIEVAYLAGLFCGDGHFSHSTTSVYEKYHVGFSLGVDKSVLLPILEHLFVDCWGGHITHSKNKCDVGIKDKFTYLRWQKLVPKSSSHGVSVPDWVFQSTADIRSEFLVGAFDSDGSAHSRRLTITSVCERYILQLIALAGSLGIYGKIRVAKQVTNLGAVTSYNFDVFSASSIQAFPDSRIPRKQERITEFKLKSYTQCGTELVPMCLVRPFNVPGAQSTFASNRLFSNGNIRGWATRDAVRMAIDSNPVLTPLGTVLNHRYDPVLSVTTGKKCAVYDLKVPKISSFYVNNVLVHNCDYSQGELKVIACIAFEETMLQAYLDGMDLHVITSCGVSNLTYQQMLDLKKTDKEKYAYLRQLGKAGNFGLIYGMGVDGFIEYALSSFGVVLSYEQAATFRDGFFEKYHKLLVYHERYRRFAKKNGYIRGPMGRIRHLPLINSPVPSVRSQEERRAINSAVQGALSDMMIWAIALQTEADVDRKSPCFGAIHDAGYWYLPEDGCVLEAKKIVWTMENLPFAKVGWKPQLKFTADAKIGPSMGSLTEVKF